eukprot:1152901-Pelagomonas_calceolata.AAC.1
MIPLHHKATKQKVLMGIWRVTGSTRLQKLPVRSIIVFNSTPSELVSILMLDEKVSPAADQPESRAVGQTPLVTLTLLPEGSSPSCHPHARFASAKLPPQA